MLARRAPWLKGRDWQPESQEPILPCLGVPQQAPSSIWYAEPSPWRARSQPSHICANEPAAYSQLASACNKSRSQQSLPPKVLWLLHMQGRLAVMPGRQARQACDVDKLIEGDHAGAEAASVWAAGTALSVISRHSRAGQLDRRWQEWRPTQMWRGCFLSWIAVRAAHPLASLCHGLPALQVAGCSQPEVIYPETLRLQGIEIAADAVGNFGGAGPR